MSTEHAQFTDDIPLAYDRRMGPVLFHDYADHMARHLARLRPQRVLETCAGTGIVTRCLRDLLPAATAIVATDLNPSMLNVARTKFRPGEAVEFQPADAMLLPFSDQSFDMLVCQFGVMFFPDKAKAYQEAYRVLISGGRYAFSVWDGSVCGAPLATLDVIRHYGTLQSDRSDQAGGLLAFCDNHLRATASGASRLADQRIPGGPYGLAASAE